MNDPVACACACAANGGARARRWSEADAEHVDVRGLSPPQPLVAIVQVLESVGETRAVVAHLDRDPLMLYPELAERGWTAERLSTPDNEVRLRLTRAAPDA